MADGRGGALIREIFAPAALAPPAPWAASLLARSRWAVGLSSSGYTAGTTTAPTSRIGPNGLVPELRTGWMCGSPAPTASCSLVVRVCAAAHQLVVAVRMGLFRHWRHLHVIPSAEFSARPPRTCRPRAATSSSARSTSTATAANWRSVRVSRTARCCIRSRSSRGGSGRRRQEHDVGAPDRRATDGGPARHAHRPSRVAEAIRAEAIRMAAPTGAYRTAWAAPRAMLPPLLAGLGGEDDAGKDEDTDAGTGGAR